MELTEIRISSNGKWYFGGSEMFRRNILNVLAIHIEKDEQDNYWIKFDGDINPLVVEDEPFYATGIVEKDDTLKLAFYDLQEMPLDKEQKVYFKDEVPYISYRWVGDTRLSRGVYWKLSEYFVFRGEEVYIVPPQPIKN